MKLLENWTIGPFVEAGKVLRGPSRFEPPAPTMTPEQQALQREAGPPKSPFAMSREELADPQSKLLTAAMLAAGGHTAGGPRFGVPPTPLPQFMGGKGYTPSEPSPVPSEGGLPRTPPPPEFDIPPPQAAPGPPPTPKPTSIPPELQDVVSGQARAFLKPPSAEGTVPTAGEQAVRGLDLRKFAKENELGYFKAKDKTEVVFHPDQTSVSKLKQLDKQGKLPEIVNGPGTAPKPVAPVEAVTARTPEGTEIRTVLTETPEQSQAAVAAQPPTTKVEIAPAAEAAPKIIQERVQGPSGVGFEGYAPPPVAGEVPPPVTPKAAPAPQPRFEMREEIAALKESAPLVNQKRRKKVINTGTARFKKLEGIMNRDIPDFVGKQKITLKDEANRPYLNVLAQLETDGNAKLGLFKDAETISLGPWSISKGVRGKHGLRDTASLQEQAAVVEKIVSSLRKQYGDDMAAVTTAYWRPESAKHVFGTGTPIKKNEPPVIAGGGAVGAELLVPPRVPESATGKAININLDRLKTTDDVKMVIDRVAQEYKGSINEARRQTITFEETQKLADDLGMTVEQLLKRQKGQAFNAEQALAARQILVKSAEDLHVLREEYRTAYAAKESTEGMLVRFGQAVVRHKAIQEQVSGLTAEAGRSLSQFRMMAKAVTTEEQAMAHLTKVFGSRKMSKEFLERFATLDTSDPLVVNRFVRDATKPSLRNYLYEVWLNGLLSAPTTHIANTVSNTVTRLATPVEKGVAAGLDLVRAGVTRTPRERFFGEVTADLYGTVAGLRDGLRRGIKAYRTEGLGEGLVKVEHLPVIPGKTGELVRTPTRLLTAEDVFFKAIAESAELHTLAYRTAMSEGHRGAARAARTAELLANPPDHFYMAMKQAGDYQTFTKQLGKMGKNLMTARDSSMVAKVVSPFMRTPANIAKYTLERTPLNAPRVAKQILKGELTGGEASAELAKPVLGSLIGASVVLMAAEGHITGGGSPDLKVRNMQRETGWQPYSVKIGDRYYAYNRLEPFGSIAGMAADLHEGFENYEPEKVNETVKKITTSLADNLTNKTFLQQLENLSDAVSDPARYGEGFLKTLTGSVVPSAVGKVAQAIDPTIRETTIATAPLAKIPGLSQQLPEKTSVFGETVERPGTGWERLFSPMQRSGERDDREVEREVARLGLAIGKPSEEIRLKGFTLKRDDATQRDFENTSGEMAKLLLLPLITSTYYQSLPEDMQREQIRTIMSRVRLILKYGYLPDDDKK